MVDPQAILVRLPQANVDALQLEAVGSFWVGRDDSREREWVVYRLTLEVEGRSAELDAIGDANGSEVVLGAAALFELGLKVDAPCQRLVPRSAEP